MWREVNRYRIASGGQSEDLILERDDDGNFRLRNDFGNVNIEFDSMTGIEFVRRLLDDVRGEVEYDLNDLFDDSLFDDSDDDSTDTTTKIKNKIGRDCDGKPD